jgi:hypothetical protein
MPSPVPLLSRFLWETGWDRVMSGEGLMADKSSISKVFVKIDELM